VVVEEAVTEVAISLNTCGYPLILGVVRWSRGLSPPVIRTAVRGANGRFKVVKVILRIAYVDGKIVERDVVGAINIGLKYLSSNGSPMALGSTGAHEVRVRLVIPHLGPTPLTGLQIFTDTIKYR
jgi:hypothetical protein